MRFSNNSAYCTYLTWCVIRVILRSVLDPIAKTIHEEASVLCKVLGNLMTVFTTLERGFLLCHLDVNYILTL